MSEIVRLYKYKDLFAGRRFVTKAELIAGLEAQVWPGRFSHRDEIVPSLNLQP